MKRVVLVGVVIVMIAALAFLILQSPAGPRVDVSHLVPIADQTMLVLVNEYYYDFERQYDSLDESDALESGACASRLFFEADRDGCIESWAARRFDFTTENSTGFLTYLIFEDESYASGFINETLERITDPTESIPLVRSETAGLAGFASHALGSDVDELLALVIRTEEGRIFALLQRMGQIVIVSFEDTSLNRLERRYLFATTYDFHESAIAYHNLSYDEL
jgi:hypothetical protein